MIDSDLAMLYKVSTKRLNEQVKRNRKRFPLDFMFQLTKEEKEEVVAICDHLKKLKFSPSLPYVFTEQGVAMLSSVLNSEKAVQVNIQIMRVFTKLHKMILNHKQLASKFDELERKVSKQDQRIDSIFEVIKRLIQEPAKSKRKIGFCVDQLM